MMRSPSKDFLMDVEQSSSSKDALWDYGGNSFATNEPNTNSSSFERILHGLGTNPDLDANLAEDNVALNETTKSLAKLACKKQTARKSIAKGNLNTGNLEDQNVEIKLEPNADDDANITAKVLHFFCQKCKNGIRYSPNDLQKHFLLCHNGELPLYPCEMCNFSAQDFQEFKQHRKTHRDALVKCEICNNDNLYTLLGLTKHFSLAHCVNGHFSCSKCRFSTRDVGTFVQHIHKHSGIEYACQKCNHVSFSKIEFQRHLQGHSSALPFSCQYCNYSAMRKDFIVKHILAKHREHVQTRDDHFQDSSNEHMAQTNSGMKLALKRTPTDTQDKSLWMQEDNGQSLDKMSTEKTSGIQFRSPDKDQAQKSFWANANSEQPLNDGNSPPATSINCNKEDSQVQGSMGLLQTAVHGPTVLMVKNNKITVPANYSATFVGYKMVNGKQNLVIKLLPSNKQSTSASQPSPQSSNSLPRYSQSSNHGSSNSMTDNRLTPTFKPPAMQSLTAVTPEKQAHLQSMTTPLGPLIARNNESISRLGSVNRLSTFETPHKTMQNFNLPISAASDVGKKIKEEPKEYNINEQQFFDSDHNYESSRDQTQSATSGRLTVDPTTGFLYRPRHSSESSNLSSTKTMYNKDLNSSLLHSSTASGLGNYSYPTFPPKCDFGMRSAQSNDRFPRPMDSNKNDNAPFMPRITSVFSLQGNAPDPKPFGKNTYLHNILQDNKRLNDKLCIAKTSSPLANSNTLPFGKQPPSSPVPRFNARVPNGNVPSAVFLKQEPDSSGSGIRPSFPTRMNELLKTHSDSIVNQQLAKERIGAVAKPGQPAFHLFRTPQVSGMQQGNTLIYPSGTNRFSMPVLPNQHGLRMISSQSNTPNMASFSNSNRLSAPVMLNTKPGMVLTIANGPFGTIRNITNGSQVMGTVNNLGKLALPRLQRPPVPHVLKSDFVSSSNNVPANIISNSNAGNKLPINLNVLQYCVNSNASGGTAGGIEGNKQSHTIQKQPLYALLPDGKQAVLLNYVLPKTAPNANLQKTVQINQVNRKPIPKKPDEAQQAAFLRSGNQANAVPAASVKEEDISAFDGYGGNVPTNKASNLVNLQSKPAEGKPCMRSNSSAASAEEPLPSGDDEKTTSLQPPRLAKMRSRQINLSTSSARSRSSKRKVSDSSSYEADFEFRTKKRVTDAVEIPRKQMLHRKCKAKSYTSEVESLPENPSPSPPPTPAPSKEVVRTLQLFPFTPNQLVKYPVKDQPVVVLNHPDADIPEVASIMRTISKFSGHILKVSLSKKTIEALLESGLLSSNEGPSGRRRRSKPASPAKDRFVLKLTLKKTSKNNYKIVKNTPTDKHQAKFNCWFCGRIFDNQDEWVGHGQRHLMEATKDWNTLF